VPAQLVQGWCTRQALKCEKAVQNQIKWTRSSRERVSPIQVTWKQSVTTLRIS
jgi:hypothetical protein